MALKPNRDVLQYEIGFFMNATATRGVMLCAGTAAVGSGAALDHINQTVEIATNPSGRYAIGVLLNDFVNQDLTQSTLNQYKDVKQIGDKAAICRKGWVEVNGIVGASAVVPGQPAYLGATGTIAATQANAYTPVIGKFLSRPDENGYARVAIEL